LVSICVWDPEGYKLDAGKRFPVKTQLQSGQQSFQGSNMC
jgi:hypothetical protein